jgi:Sulfotransferase family
MGQLTTTKDSPLPQETYFADPVFVLCNGRSGSTLLRFLLDAHPELACPPETNLPALCAQLATVWSLIEGAPLSANRGDEPPDIPDAAIAGIRQTMDRMVGSYLSRRGKKRYCDKSLGTARFAALLLRVYPEARFLCLYRHAMDVIASGLEACPWGLTGYGFDPYIATTPGNAVSALARFWTDNAAETLRAEEQFPDRCLRVRYEDLVSDPESTAAEIFSFVDAAQAPGISARCFSADRERFGPADYKIWCTSKVSAESIGRGWSVPAGMIPPPVLASMNELAEKLGYLQVDDEWGTSAPPRDLRFPTAASEMAPEASALAVPVAGSTTYPRDAAARLERTGPGKQGLANGSALSCLLGQQLRDGLQGLRPRMPPTAGPHGAESFVAVWIPADSGLPTEYWLVNLNDRSVTFASQAAQGSSDWDVVGSGDAWEQVISGRINLSVALRACKLRYCDGGDAGPLASDARIGILAVLLGLARCQ